MNVNEDTGRILWSQESKYFLVRLVQENIVIVNPDVSAETMAKKEMAWKLIEEHFAADGMPCQLGKLKRLWKRMKDTARTNIMKYNEQKRRGSKILKEPTDLDLIVAEMLAARNLQKKNKQKRRHSGGGTTSRPKVNVRFKRETSETPSESLNDNYFPNEYEPVNVTDGIGHDEENDDDYDEGDDGEEPMNNGNDGLLEPMTIIEEPTQYNGTINNGYRNGFIDQTADENMDDEDDDDEIEITSAIPPAIKISAFNNKIKSKPSKTIQPNPLALPQSPPNDNKNKLIAIELKMKQTQLQNEVERMNLEREVYRKKLILLDLQIKQTRLDIAAKSNNSNQEK